MMPGGETDPVRLIAFMQPVIDTESYVFCSVTDTGRIPRHLPVAEIKEAEGITVVLRSQDAAALGLDGDFVAARITLQIHSSLSAVGLTAAFATELARHAISCNVIAGYFHDHLYVPLTDGRRALQVLQEMQQQAAGKLT